MVQTTSLNGDWDLWYFPQGDFEVTHPSALAASGAPRVAARVPGNVELDLERAGILHDLFVGENILATQKYESFEWWYVRSFKAPAGIADRRVLLAFHGLDCFVGQVVFKLHVVQKLALAVLLEVDCVQLIAGAQA